MKITTTQQTNATRHRLAHFNSTARKLGRCLRCACRRSPPPRGIASASAMLTGDSGHTVNKAPRMRGKNRAVSRTSISENRELAKTGNRKKVRDVLTQPKPEHVPRPRLVSTRTNGDRIIRRPNPLLNMVVVAEEGTEALSVYLVLQHNALLCRRHVFERYRVGARRGRKLMTRVCVIYGGRRRGKKVDIGRHTCRF